MSNIRFSKLLGNHYNNETKMEVLNWMLETGLPFRKWIGKWNKTGVSQFLFDYSANDYDAKYSIPSNVCKWSWYFDAIFARAVYEFPNKSVYDWREKERIHPDKCRILKFNNEVPRKYVSKHSCFFWLVSNIFKMNGRYLKKKFAHLDYPERVDPKIISIQIYTTGHGWVVEYEFSFKNFNYEPGWDYCYYQEENQSLWDFFGKTYDDMQRRIFNRKPKKIST